MFDIVCFCRRLVQDGAQEKSVKLCVHNNRLVRIKKSIKMVPFQEQALWSEGKVRNYQKINKGFNKTSTITCT